MKKLLPKTAWTPEGFTLVELLVVITIIAILSVIGITIYSGVQKNARDSKRRGDVDAVSKAWEVNYVAASPHYPILVASWFGAGGIPKDPQTNVAYDYTGGVANEAVAGDTYKVCATLENPVSQYCKSNQQ